MPQELNLDLVTVLQVHKLALQRGRDQLADMLGVRLPDGWPEFPEAFEPSHTAHQEPAPWPGYFFVSPLEGAVIGNGGFAGNPTEGDVEIGYEIAPEFRNRGYATAAVLHLLAIASESSQVKGVIAHTLAQTDASNAVLVKAGLQYVGEFSNAEVRQVWRWRKDLAISTSVLVTALEMLHGLGKLSQRKMFGGTYIYCDNLFIATVHDGTLYFKANKNTAHEFLARALRQFSYPKQGEIATLQYYEAPPEVFTDRAAMLHWAKVALTAAQQDASAKKSQKARMGQRE